MASAILVLQIQKLFAHLDTNGNGHLDLDEFVAFCECVDADRSAKPSARKKKKRQKKVKAKAAKHHWGKAESVQVAGSTERRTSTMHFADHSKLNPMDQVKMAKARALRTGATITTVTSPSAAGSGGRHRASSAAATERSARRSSTGAMRPAGDAVASSGISGGGTGREGREGSLLSSSRSGRAAGVAGQTSAAGRAQTAGMLMHPLQGGGSGRTGLAERFGGHGSIHYLSGVEQGGPWSVAGTETATAPMFSSFNAAAGAYPSHSSKPSAAFASGRSRFEMFGAHAREAQAAVAKAQADAADEDAASAALRQAAAVRASRAKAKKAKAKADDTAALPVPVPTPSARTALDDVPEPRIVVVSLGGGGVAPLSPSAAAVVEQCRDSQANLEIGKVCAKKKAARSKHKGRSRNRGGVPPPPSAPPQPPRIALALPPATSQLSAAARTLAAGMQQGAMEQLAALQTGGAARESPATRAKLRRRGAPPPPPQEEPVYDQQQFQAMFEEEYKVLLAQHQSAR